MLFDAKRKYDISKEERRQIMQEVFPNLFVGNQADYDDKPELFWKGWSIIHAAKFPYHRSALGYQTKAAPKGPGYFFVYNGKGELCLNIVDCDDPSFFNEGMIREAVNFASISLSKGMKVLIHCNQGESRSPVIAILVMKRMGFYQEASFELAESRFKQLYQNYHPKNGIRQFAISNWGIF